MPSITIIREAEVARTPRVLQMEGMFDVPPSARSVVRWEADLPLHEKPWNIGLIVGASGSGQTTVAREVIGERVVPAVGFEWPQDRSVLHGFPPDMPIKQVVGYLTSVGFSSP